MNLNSSFISIIVPVYNSEKYLSACLDSLLSQSFSGFEIILVDDGSTDNSGQICDDYVGKDNRIKVIHQRNSGVSVARNVGLEHASGVWITFVDSDDELLPTALEIFMKYADGDYDLIECDYELVVNGKRVDPEMEVQVKEMCRRDFYDAFFNYSWNSYHGYACIKLYKASIIRDNNISFATDIFIREDGLFVCEYVSKCNKILYSTEVVYKYIQRENSAVNTFLKEFNKKSITHLEASIRIYNLIRQIGADSRLLDDARYSVCSSYSKLLSAYRQMRNKDVESYATMKSLFQKYVSTTYYIKFRVYRVFHILKRQCYLFLRLLRLRT